jgi:hypothetical protein
MKSSIPLAEEFVDAVVGRRKRTTIRAGQRSYTLGPTQLTSAKRKVPVRIVAVRYKRFRDLTDADAVADGFESINSLSAVLMRFYPALKPSDLVTIVEFSPL